MEITKLPENVPSLIRSGIAISSVSQCVTEMVLNALDADSTRIGVRFDLSRHQLQVVDDGYGLSKDQLNLIGKRYVTSKYNSSAELKDKRKYFGYRGEVLASVRKICDSLLIFSKPKGDTTTYCKVMKSNDSDCSEATIAQLDRPGHGTTVVVINLFSNLPVRQKRLHHAIESESIRNELQAIALIHPQVSFTLRNDVTKTVILHTQKCTDIVQNFYQIFNSDIDVKEFQFVSISEGNFNVTGYICRETTKSKKYQFLYINKRYVINSKLHSFVNKKLKKSFYLKTINCGNNSKKDDCFFSDNFVAGNDKLDSLKDDYAIFVINIDCPLSDYDICFNSKACIIEFKNWYFVFKLIDKYIDEFLGTESHLHKVDGQLNVELKRKNCDTEEDISKVDLAEGRDKSNVSMLMETNDHSEPVVICDTLCDSTNMEHQTPCNLENDYGDCILFSKNKNSIAHSEHLLTECEDCKTPCLNNSSEKAVRNCDCSVVKRSIMPNVCKDFYENNLKLLKMNVQCINRVLNPALAFGTPKNILDGDKFKPIKEIRKYNKNPNYKNQNNKIKKVHFNDDSLTITNTVNGSHVKNIKPHKKQRSILKNCNVKMLSDVCIINKNVKFANKTVTSNTENNESCNGSTKKIKCKTLCKIDGCCSHSHSKTLKNKNINILTDIKTKGKVDKWNKCKTKYDYFNENDKNYFAHGSLLGKNFSKENSFCLKNNNISNCKRSSDVDFLSNSNKPHFHSNDVSKKFVKREIKYCNKENKLDNNMYPTQAISDVFHYPESKYFSSSKVKSKHEKDHKIQSVCCFHKTSKHSNPDEENDSFFSRSNFKQKEDNFLKENFTSKYFSQLDFLNPQKNSESNQTESFEIVSKKRHKDNKINFDNIHLTKRNFQINSGYNYKQMNNLAKEICNFVEHLPSSNAVCYDDANNKGNSSISRNSLVARNVQEDNSLVIKTNISFYDDSIIEMCISDIQKDFEKLKISDEVANDFGNDDINDNDSKMEYIENVCVSENEAYLNDRFSVPAVNKPSNDIDKNDNKDSHPHKEIECEEENGNVQENNIAVNTQEQTYSPIEFHDSMNIFVCNTDVDDPEFTKEFNDYTKNLVKDNFPSSCNTSDFIKNSSHNEKSSNENCFTDVSADNNNYNGKNNDFNSDIFSLNIKYAVSKEKNRKSLNKCSKKLTCFDNGNENLENSITNNFYLEEFQDSNLNSSLVENYEVLPENENDFCYRSLSDNFISLKRKSEENTNNDTCNKKQCRNENEIFETIEGLINSGEESKDVNFKESFIESNTIDEEQISKTINLEQFEENDVPECEEIPSVKLQSWKVATVLDNVNFQRISDDSSQHLKKKVDSMSVKLMPTRLTGLFSEQMNQSPRTSENDKSLANNLHHDHDFSENTSQMLRLISSDWKEHKTPSGENIYIHVNSGMSSFSFQNYPENNVYDMSSRHWFWPKGVSPLKDTNINDAEEYHLDDEGRNEMINLINENEKTFNESCNSNAIKWRDYKKIDCDVLSLLKTSTSYEKSAKLVKTPPPAVNNCSFTKDDLSKAEVVGLFNEKFIMTTMMCSNDKLIVVFDQHAVDERIRYENLCKGYKTSSSRANSDDETFVKTRINPQLVLPITENKAQIIKSFPDKLQKIGLTVDVTDDCSTVVVSAVPTCLYNRVEKESSGEMNSKLMELVTQLLDEHIDSIMKTNGAGLKIPFILNSLICYEACRSAVKFGDKVSLSAAKLMIDQLSKCTMPFQCAHGRPVLAPIYNLRKD